MKQAQGSETAKGRKWVRRMNNIRTCGTEIVNEEITYA